MEEEREEERAAALVGAVWSGAGAEAVPLAVAVAAVPRTAELVAVEVRATAELVAVEVRATAESVAAPVAVAAVAVAVVVAVVAVAVAVVAVRWTAESTAELTEGSRPKSLPRPRIFRPSRAMGR